MTMLILNGVLMGEAEATLPATDRALTHGLGLYETIKLIEGVPVFFEEHVARLVHGIAALGLDKRIDRPELAEQICRLSEANGYGDNSCRLLVTAGPPTARPACSCRPTGATSPPRPLRVISYRGVRVSAQYKAMTVMQSYFAQRAARLPAWTTPCWWTARADLRGSHVQCVRGARRRPRHAAGRGRHPPGRAARQGRGARDGAGIPVVEAWARVADLRPDDGVLLTSSVRGIVPVERVDDVRAARARAGAHQLRALIDDAEAASAAAFRAAYL